jgi:hypothetical protein
MNSALPTCSNQAETRHNNLAKLIKITRRIYSAARAAASSSSNPAPVPEVAAAAIDPKNANGPSFASSQTLTSFRPGRSERPAVRFWPTPRS